MIRTLLAYLLRVEEPAPPDPVFSDGMRAERHGYGPDACPYVREEQAARWLEGWRHSEWMSIQW
jgi:ribosome modulation factor